MGFFGKSIVLQTLLALCFFTSSVFTLGVNQPGADPLQLLPPLLPLPQTPPLLLPPLLPLPPLRLPTLPQTPPFLRPPPPLLPLPPVRLSTLPRSPPFLPPPMIQPAPIKLPSLPPVKLPTFPPAKAPIKLPTLPPTIAPIKPPVLPPRTSNKILVAIQGKVYCKSCKYPDDKDLQGAKLFKGAVVRFFCVNRKLFKPFKPIYTMTDKYGSYLIIAPKTVNNYNIKFCQVSIVKSPDAKCNKVSLRYGRYMGFMLKPQKSTVTFNKLKYTIFNVGPLAFSPACPK